MSNGKYSTRRFKKAWPKAKRACATAEYWLIRTLPRGSFSRHKPQHRAKIFAEVAKRRLIGE